MSDKLLATHRERTAIVYVRQSSRQQVRDNVESRQRQYGLKAVAERLGFSRVVTIDEDLGISGSGGHERPGFARLLTAVCEGGVGAVFALEVTRLARNNRDWHHLIDLCALTDTLVIDADGVYDPRLLNDRMILGMKGSLAEFEVGLIQQRAQQARKEMVRRGAVLWEVPVGYVRTEDYRVELIPDRQVQEALRGVFQKFQELGSARQVLLWYRQEQILVPHAKAATAGREIEWGLPINGRIIKMLKNPCYAGAFAFGKTCTKTIVRDGRGRKCQGHRRALNEWEVLIPEHHEGYLTWEQFLRNQKTLEQNASARRRGGSGAAKRGTALLAGLLRCARCGRMLHVAYSGSRGNVSRYWCRGANINHGAKPCFSVGSLRLDQAVSEEVLRATAPLAVEAAVEASCRWQVQEDEKRKSLDLALQKARYEADRARRQYDAVDPENRLVAGELESRWNQTLNQVASLECRLGELPPAQDALSEQEHERLLQLGTDLEAVWSHPQAKPALKKRILRTVLQEIVIDVSAEPPEMTLVLHWSGGAHTKLRVPKNRTGQHRHRVDRDVVELIRELTKVCKDEFTAAILNRLGYRTGNGNTWTETRVRSLRTHQKIPALHLTGAKWLTLEKTAEVLQVSTSVVRRLIQRKTLPASQVVKHAPWIIQRENLQLPIVQSAIRAVREGRQIPRTDPQQRELPLKP